MSIFPPTHEPGCFQIKLENYWGEIGRTPEIPKSPEVFKNSFNMSTPCSICSVWAWDWDSKLCRIKTSQSVQALKQVKPTNKKILKEFGRFLPFFPPLIFYCLAPVGQFPCWLSKGINIKEIKNKNKRSLVVIFCWRFSMQLLCPKTGVW